MANFSTQTAVGIVPTSRMFVGQSNGAQTSRSLAIQRVVRLRCSGKELDVAASPLQPLQTERSHTHRELLLKEHGRLDFRTKVRRSVRDAKRDRERREGLAGHHRAFARGCGCRGRLAAVEPRDIVFQDVVREFGDASELDWHKLPLRRQASLLRVALRPRGFLIDPASTYMRWWDAVVVFALFYTAIVTPVEVALLRPLVGATADSENEQRRWLARFDLCINAVFIKDMLLQFFIKVRPESLRQGQNNRWVRDPRVLASRYLQGWFLIDFLSVFPFEEVAEVLSPHASDNTKVLRAMRLCRLLRLARILRASRLLRRWENRIVIPFAQQALYRFLTAIMVIAHWMACVWALVGLELASNFRCDVGGNILLAEVALAAGESWITRHSVRADIWSWGPDDPCNPMHVYAKSLHFSVMTITSIGYGDIAPGRLEEYWVCIGCQLIGGMTWAYIIGSACGVVTNMDPEHENHKSETDELNRMMSKTRVPVPLRQRLRRYMTQLVYHKKVTRAQSLCQDFSPDLRGELMLSTPVGRAISKVWYFQLCDHDFLLEVGSKMEAHFMNTREISHDIVRRLGFCERGCVARAGRIFPSGSIWGEDLILNSDYLKDTSPVTALTFSEVFTLKRHDLDSIAAFSPTASLILRRAAVSIALRRAARIVSGERKRQSGNNSFLHAIFGGGTAKEEDLVMPLLDHDDAVPAHLLPPLHRQLHRAVKDLQHRCQKELMLPLTSLRHRDADATGSWSLASAQSLGRPPEELAEARPEAKPAAELMRRISEQVAQLSKQLESRPEIRNGLGANGELADGAAALLQQFSTSL